MTPDAHVPSSGRRRVAATHVHALIGALGLGGRRFVRRSRRLATVSSVTLIVLSALAATLASAAGGPIIDGGNLEAREVHATRVSLRAALNGTLDPALRFETPWRMEYATSEAGPWIVGESGTIHPHNGETTYGISVGIQHLSPTTTYYARLVAENAGGRAEATTKFTTTGVTPPEALDFDLIPNIGRKAQEEDGLFQVGTTLANWEALIQTNGAATEYDFEYSLPEGGHAPSEGSASWVPFTSGASGTVTVAEDFARPEAKLTGLTPATTYYVRVKAANGHEPAVVEVTSFKTQPASPEAGVAGVFNASATSAYVTGGVSTRSSETHWRLEYATSPSGPWNPGTTGTIALAEAGEGGTQIIGELTGLAPATNYYVRLSADNGHEPAATSNVQHFQTAGPPAARTFAAHAFELGGATLRLLGSVEPRTEPIDELQTVTVGGSPTGGTFTLTFKGQTTAPLPFDAEIDQVREALEALSTIGGKNRGENVEIISEAVGSPWTVKFTGALGGSNQPQIEANASGLTPSGTVEVATVEDGFSYAASAHFEYVSQKQFEEPGPEGGWAKATSTPARGIGEAGQDVTGSLTFGAGLPSLIPGETYRYRVVATNTTSGDSVAQGEEQTLAVPAPVAPGAEAACPNEAFRTGPSAHLPDCRAYEQVTPTEKSGSMDTFNYNLGNASSASVSQDGNHVVVETGGGTKWGANPDPTNSTYFFARQEGVGWSMVSATPPGAGANSYRPEIFSSDLAQVGVQVGWSTGAVVADTSPNLEFEVGPAGGPYTTVASIPRTQMQGPDVGWADASPNLNKLILASEDRTLGAEGSTGTKTGSDLYEYSAGELRQLNVTGEGTTIGRCGAVMPQGRAEPAVKGTGYLASPHAVSSDGSRVFFEAVPSSDCSEPQHLYMRTDGGSAEAQTVDVGAYKYLAANPAGTKLLLEKRGGEDHQIVLYESETGDTQALFATHEEINSPAASEDLGAIYFTSGEALTRDATVPSPQSEFQPSVPVPDEDLYRYDVSTRSLRFTGVQGATAPYATPDGRYLYFTGGVAGVLGGLSGVTTQVYRYDSATNLVECLSCSSFDPRPRVSSQVLLASVGSNSVPSLLFASANGAYVVFTTAAALLPSDIDGEFGDCNPVGVCEGLERGTHLFEENISTDVYEWRSDGTTGCAQVDGCLALITSGTGGLRNQFLGVANEGHDIFFATHSQFVAADQDAQGDVYDARVDGGFPAPPAGQVECEGSACSTPVGAPIDATPSSFTFSGAENVAAPSSGNAVAPSGGRSGANAHKAKKKPKPKTRPKGRRTGRKTAHAQRATDRHSGRSGR